MNRKVLCVLVLAMVGVGALLLRESLAQARPAAAPTRVGVCDVMELLDNYDRAKDLMNGLEKEKDAIEAEGKKRKDKIDQMNQQLDGLIPNSPEYGKLLDEMEEMAFELKAWMECGKSRTLRKHLRLTQDLYQEIRQAVGAVAKSRGVDVVLFFERKERPTNSTPELARQIETRQVVWHDPRLDLTEAVLTHLNKAYKERKP